MIYLSLSVLLLLTIIAWVCLTLWKALLVLQVSCGPVSLIPGELRRRSLTAMQLNPLNPAVTLPSYDMGIKV